MRSATTHLLIGSSPTPNAIPPFLTNAIPLLAPDISANFLNALHPALALCVCLEELNIMANPLRALPVFLSSLHSSKSLLRTLPGLQHCLPWKALVEALLAKAPMSPLYPPSTPMFPPPSASIQSIADTDVEDLSDTPQTTDGDLPPSVPPRLTRSTTAPSIPPLLPSPVSPGLSLTRTTPNRNQGPIVPLKQDEYSLECEVRKMKSVGELRRYNTVLPPTSPPSLSTSNSPQRLAVGRYGTSGSSTNLLSVVSPTGDSGVPSVSQAWVSSVVSTPGSMKFRPAIDPTIRDNISGDEQLTMFWSKKRRENLDNGDS